MISSERWRNNWLLVAPSGAVRIDLGRATGWHRDRKQTVRDLPPGTRVIVCAAAPAAGWRCRRFASDAGLELEREYLAFPPAAPPAYLVEDASATIDIFVKTVLVTPPRAACATVIETCLGVLRAWHPSRLIRAIAPGRVIV